MKNRPPDPPNRNRDDNDPEKDPGSSRKMRSIWIAGAALLFVIAFVMLSSSNRFGGSASYPINMLISDIQAGLVNSVTQEGDSKVIVQFNNGTARSMSIPPTTDIWTILNEEGLADQVSVAAQEADSTGQMLFSLLLAFAPVVLIVWLLWRMMRSMRTGQDQAMGFGRSRARVTRDMERPQVTFSDVAGAEEAKEDLKEIVEFLKEPEKFIRLGARVPKGVLMIGPPGTGKTLMARAVAGEAGVPFFSISGSEFVEMFVGVGASRVRDLFDRAKAEAPAIVFIDEIDAVGRHRGAGLGGGHDEREQTLNQILVEMDGFETGTNVIIIAATNRPDILDPALMRPGRFDRKVTMDNPDVKGRLEILQVHSKGKPLASSVNLEAMARVTAGFSGADLENLINEAAILAARRNLKSVGMAELQEAMERVVMGPARKSRVMSPKEKKIVAFHEAGHAILYHMLEHADPVHKVTIVPRGRAGGFVMPLPGEETAFMMRQQFEDRIVATMGGRAAEELIFGHLSTGASSDIQQCTRWARAMVTQFGMSDILGPRAYGSGHGSVFLGRELGEQRDYSEHYAEEIDNEVKRILQSAYERARQILEDNRETLDKIAAALIELETLDRSAFLEMMGEAPDADPLFGVTKPPRKSEGKRDDQADSDAGEFPRNPRSLGPAPALFDGDSQPE